MNNASDDASESSLPTHRVDTFPSSPPLLRPPRLPLEAATSPKRRLLELFENMDNADRTKSEPPLTQDEPSAKSGLTRLSSEGTQLPPSAQQQKPKFSSDGRVEEEEDIETEDEELDSEPAEAIADFDWDDLMMRYHRAMDDCTGEESQLTEDWQSLMNYFRIWAESGHIHETDRTFGRLRTRATYVQNSEDQLEKTRNHYVNVVKAFESALNLLKANGFGG